MFCQQARRIGQAVVTTPCFHFGGHSWCYSRWATREANPQGPRCPECMAASGELVERELALHREGEISRGGDQAGRPLLPGVEELVAEAADRAAVVDEEE